MVCHDHGMNRGEVFAAALLRGRGCLRTELVGRWTSGSGPWERIVTVRRIVDTRVVVVWRGGQREDRCAFESVEDAEAWAERLRTPIDGMGARHEWREDGRPDQPWRIN